MENVAREQGLALQQLFPYKSYSLKNSDCHKFSFFLNGGLKVGHLIIFDALNIIVKTPYYNSGVIFD